MRAIRASGTIVVAGLLSAACGGASSVGAPTTTHGATVIVLGGTRTLTASALTATQSVITSRLNADGVVGAKVSIVGHDLRLTVPPSAAPTALTLAVPEGNLRFRQPLSILKGGTSPAQHPAGSVQQLTTAAGNGQPLPGSESPTLTATFEKTFTNWDCRKNPNPTEGSDKPSDFIIACGTKPVATYLLAPTAVEGADISFAAASLDSVTGTQWVVTLGFNHHAAAAWQDVTRKAYNVDGGRPQSGRCGPPTGCNGIAIVLDGIVKSEPYITTRGGIPGGQVQIAGGFTQTTANQLADLLKYGALPTHLRLLHQTTVR